MRFDEVKLVEYRNKFRNIMCLMINYEHLFSNFNNFVYSYN